MTNEEAIKVVGAAGATASAAEAAEAATENAPAQTAAAKALGDRLRVERALTANHANTLPMLEILRACAANEPRPYRDVEKDVYDLPIMALSHQNAHTLSLLLVDCGALEKIPVEEDAIVEDSAAAEDAGVADAATNSNSNSNPDTNLDPEDLEDQPVDYLLGITPAGAAALDTFEPTKRYQRMMAGEPASYREVYRKVLSLCEQGMRVDDIEDSLTSMPQMRTPKTVYAGHFVSNLETVNGIEWDDAQGIWKTTPHGRIMATL